MDLSFLSSDVLPQIYTDENLNPKCVHRNWFFCDRIQKVSAHKSIHMTKLSMKFLECTGQRWARRGLSNTSKECQKKHCKNCKCCPASLLIVRQQRLSWIQVLNCQNCNQCLKGHKSLDYHSVSDSVSEWVTMPPIELSNVHRLCLGSQRYLSGYKTGYNDKWMASKLVVSHQICLFSSFLNVRENIDLL